MSEDLYEYQMDVEKSIKYYEEELERRGGKDEAIEYCLSVYKKYKAEGKTTISVSKHPVYKPN